MVNGKPRHVLGYLQDFLFHPKRAMTPVRALSGGERNRLLLARLFLKPSNLLILDEPTNDLDVETLELLEELIDGYQGTVMLVSHDRQFCRQYRDRVLDLRRRRSYWPVRRRLSRRPRSAGPVFGAKADGR